jgi:ferredoxin
LQVNENIKIQLSKRSKRLHIDSWCIGCGNCVKACTSGALSLENGKAVLNKDKCVLCGYCSSYCRDFCIKIV